MLLYYLFKNEVVSKKKKKNWEKKYINYINIIYYKNDIAVFSHQQVNALMVTGAICILFLVAALFAMFALITVNIYVFYKTSKSYLIIMKYSNRHNNNRINQPFYDLHIGPCGSLYLYSSSTFLSILYYLAYIDRHSKHGVWIIHGTSWIILVLTMIQKQIPIQMILVETFTIVINFGKMN